MKILFGTVDACRREARDRGLRHDEWMMWDGNMLGRRFREDDVIITDSWPWVRERIPHEKYVGVVSHLATRMDFNQNPPEGL